MKNLRRGSRQALLLTLAPLVLFGGCSLIPRPHAHLKGNRAFIQYWPPDANNSALRVAVKDNIDMKGVVTTAGSEHFAKTNPPAAKDAACLAIARQRNVQFVGKTNLSEFAVSPSGFNEYYGTPKSPLRGWRKPIPGGSSCGSAVAVADGLADVAFGTDTAGSVRVPAACCGVVGLKTTYGLIPIEGIYPIEPKHLDTVGPMGKDIAHTVLGMDLLQKGFADRYAAAQAAHPSAAKIRIGRLKLNGTNAKIDEAVDRALAQAGFQVIPLGDEFRDLWEKAKSDGDAVAAGGAWLSDGRYLNFTGVSARSKAAILVGSVSYATSYRGALARQAAWQAELRRVFRKVDFIALPTIQTTPPLVPFNLKIGVLEALVLILQNTVPANFAGNPALAMPVPLENRNIPVTSLQLIGPLRSEAALLNAGRLVEKAVAKR